MEGAVSGSGAISPVLNCRPVFISTILTSLALALNITLYVLTTKWHCCDAVERCKKAVCKPCRKQHRRVPVEYQEETEVDQEREEDRGIEGEREMAEDYREMEDQEMDNDEDAMAEDDERMVAGGGKCCKCTSSTFVTVFIVIHLVGKVGLIVTNITYLAILGFREENPFDSTSDVGKGNELAFASNYITSIAFLYELLLSVGVPLLSLCGFVCSFKDYKERLERGETTKMTIITEYLQLWRWSDVVLAFGFAPFASTDLFFRGGLWLIAIPTKVLIYASSFSSSVVAGMRFMVGLFCRVFCECTCSTDQVEIKNFKGVLPMISRKMIPLMLKISISSAVLAAYLAVVAAMENDALRITYLVFTLTRGITALFSMGYIATLLRWKVLSDNKQLKEGRIVLFLGLLNHFEPHTHVVFVVDLVTYVGLLVMNFVIIGTI